MLEFLTILAPQDAAVSSAPPDQAAAPPSADDVFERAFGKRQTTPARFDYPIFVDDERIGAVDVAVGASPEETTLDGPALLAALYPLLDAAIASDLLSQVTSAPGGRLSLADLHGIGLDVVFDNQLLALRLDLPLALRQRRVISRQDRYLREVANALKPEPFSIILNARLDLLYGDEDNRGYRRLPASGVMDLAVNMRGWVLETGVDLRESLGPETPNIDRHEFQRKLTVLTWDDPARARRFRLGDIQAEGSGFVALSPLLGASWGRDYTLQPFRERRPRNLQDFEIADDALVDVYVNGVLARSLRLTPGRYSLADLPIIQAASNVVEIIARNSLGVETRYAFDAFSSTSLLAVGETDWGASAGVERYFDRGRLRYDTDRFVFSGFYERGLTNTFTGGGGLRLTQEGGVLSGLAVKATAAGSFSLRAAISQYEGLGAGGAVDLTYNYQSAAGGLRSGWKFNGNLGWRSPDFAPVATLGTSGLAAPEWTAAATVSAPLTPTIGWFASGSYAVLRNRPDSHTATIGGSWAFQRAQLTASLGYASGLGAGRFERNETFIRLQLNWRFGIGSGASASYDSRSDLRRVEYLRTGVPGVGALDYRIGYQGVEGSEALTGELGYVGNRYEVRASQDYETFVVNRGPDDVVVGDQHHLRTRAALGTAVVYAGGRWALSRPVADSFALIRGHQDLEGVDVAVNPDLARPEHGLVYQARSDWLGDAVLSDLFPYRPQIVTVQPLDAQRSAASPKDSPVFATYRSGVIVDYGEGGGVGAIGFLRDASGEPIGLRSGVARPLDDPSSAGTLIFSNEAGRYYGDGLRPGRTYVIELSGEENFSGVLVVPEDARGVVRGLDIRLTPRESTP